MEPRIIGVRVTGPFTVSLTFTDGSTGSVDLMSCGRGAPTNGVCGQVYTQALEGGPPGTVLKLFGDPKSPIGVANNIFTCDVDANCPCGQKLASLP